MHSGWIPFPIISQGYLSLPLHEEEEDTMDVDAPEDQPVFPTEDAPNSEDLTWDEGDIHRLHSVILGMHLTESLKRLDSEVRLKALFGRVIQEEPADRELVERMVYFAAELYEESTLPPWIQQALKVPSPLFRAAITQHPETIFSHVKERRLDLLQAVGRSDPPFWLSLRGDGGHTVLHAAIQNGQGKIALWLVGICPALITATNSQNEYPLDMYSAGGIPVEFVDQLMPSSSPWECLSLLCRLRDPNLLWRYVQSKSKELVKCSLEEIRKPPPDKNPFFVCVELGKGGLAMQLIHQIFGSTSHTTDVIYACVLGPPQLVRQVVARSHAPAEGQQVYSDHSLIEALPIYCERELENQLSSDRYVIIALHYLLREGFSGEAEIFLERLPNKDTESKAFYLFYAGIGSALEDQYWRKLEEDPVVMMTFLDRLSSVLSVPRQKTECVSAAILRLLESGEFFSSDTVKAIIRLLPLLNNKNLAKSIFTSQDLIIEPSVLAMLIKPPFLCKQSQNQIRSVQEFLTLPEVAPYLGELVVKGKGNFDAIAWLFEFAEDEDEPWDWQVSFRMATWLWNTFPAKCKRWAKSASADWDPLVDVLARFIKKKVDPETYVEALKMFITWDPSFLQRYESDPRLSLRSLILIFGDQELRTLLPEKVLWTAKEMHDIVAFIGEPEEALKLDASCLEEESCGCRTNSRARSASCDSGTSQISGGSGHDVYSGRGRSSVISQATRICQDERSGIGCGLFNYF